MESPAKIGITVAEVLKNQPKIDKTSLQIEKVKGKRGRPPGSKNKIIEIKKEELI